MIAKTHFDFPQHFLSSLSGNINYEFALFENDDVSTLCDIEKTINPSPWDASNFHSSLARDQLCLGIKNEQQWVAYAVCSKVLDEAEILIIGVDTAHQNKGLGKALLNALLEILRRNTKTLFLEVRASNEAAINLYQSAGFNCVGERPGYYPSKSNRGKREDAFIFALELEP